MLNCKPGKSSPLSSYIRFDRFHPIRLKYKIVDHTLDVVRA